MQNGGQTLLFTFICKDFACLNFQKSNSVQQMEQVFSEAIKNASPIEAREAMQLSNGAESSETFERNADRIFFQSAFLNSFGSSQSQHLLEMQAKNDHQSVTAYREVFGKCSSELQVDIEDKDSLTYDDLANKYYEAVVEGNQEMLEEIVFKHKFDINVVFTEDMKFTCKHRGWSAIHIAASHNNVKTTRFLLDMGCDIEAVTNDEDTALHIAAKYGASDVVSLLLERNIFLRDRQNNKGATALLKAVFNIQHSFRENYRRCVDILIGAGCNTNISSASKVTALHVAVDRGDLYLVQKLINAKANVNALCNRNTSPLMHALVAKYVNSNIVAELLHAKADTSVKVNGRSTLHIAVSRCDESVIYAFLKNGADPNCQDSLGNTPLWIAVEENNVKVVPILVEGGGNVNYIHEPDGKSLLCQAITNNSLYMVKLLLNLGASAYTETVMWSTPLHLAVDQQNISIVKELLRVNCPLNTTSNAKFSLKPMTPVQLAMELGNVEIICLLMQAGCKIQMSWLREDRISNALIRKHDAVRHIQKYVAEVPSLLHLSRMSIREYLRDRFKKVIQDFVAFGIIPNKMAAYISLSDILD